MPPDAKPLEGLVFVDPATGAEYGVIRAAVDARHPAASSAWRPIAEDECGNAFVLSPTGSVAFWDHETGKRTVLASDWVTFAAGCRPPSPVEVDPAQVKSVWVDPAFARSLGKTVPEDGWIKRPTRRQEKSDP